MENRRNILMDCDPGIDDAAALCVAAAHPEAFRILGISTVAGNQTIETVTENALRLTQFFGLDVPVAQGAKLPLTRPAKTAADIHGKNGLGDVEIPKTDRKAVSDNAVVFLRDQIMGLPKGERVTLVPTGPLTNIALLLKVFPEVRERVEEIVLMGGGACKGNVTPVSEFNIFADPEAASIVFESGLPVVMCGLDVTGKCGVDRETARELAGSGKKIARAVGSMIQFYLNSPAYRNRPAAYVHDAATFLYLLHPEIFRGERMPVSVDCSDGITRGMTICDARPTRPEGEYHTLVLLDADEKKFLEYLVEAVHMLDARLDG